MPEPTKIPRPFADSGDKNSIPDSSGGLGFASWQEGFPAITGTPFAQGGVAPKRADFNGIFNALSLATLWQQQGGFYAYDNTTDYEVGNVVEYNNDLYKCITANGPGSAVKAPTDATVWSKVMTAADIAAVYLPLSGGTMTGTIEKSSGYVIKSTGTNNYLAILGGTGGMATDGAQVIVHGPGHAESGAFILHAGNSNGYKRLIGKPDGTLTWDGYQLSPIAKSASGVGQWQRLFVNAASISLPAGGTWAYYVTGFSSGGSLISVQANVAAGGTTVISDAIVARCYGFCWRVA